MVRAALLLLLTLAVGGCGGGDDAPPPVGAGPDRVLDGAEAQAPASATAGTLALVPDGPRARRRLGYANLDALAAADLPVARDRLVRRVLGAGAAGSAGTAVRIGGGGADTVGTTPPQTSAITPAAASAAQSCLGDTLAQTILGPGTMGDDAALGVGLAESGDRPAGIQVRICAAPHYLRHVHAAEKAFERRFGGLGRAEAVWGEQEIGEREIGFATVAADALPRATVLELLAGGPALRSLAWR
jgi:hypothetical protein